MRQDIKALGSLLLLSREIVIVTHANPDGDAMGSTLALMRYLRNQGKRAYVITPTPYASFLKWLPGDKDVIVYSYQQELAKKKIEICDLVCCLDFNALHRINELGELIEKRDVKKAVIDHHLFPGKFQDVLVSNTKASSTCELIYEVIEQLTGSDAIDEEIANCIYTGILTDTGGFQFSCTTPRVHQIVADLLQKGVKPDIVQNRVFNSFNENRLKLLGHCLSNRMTVYPEYHAAMIYLTKEDWEKFNVKGGDTEGIVNYPLKMQDVYFSCFIIERPDLIKMSFRSKGDFDVNSFAGTNFEGGGHANAAGGKSQDNLEKTIERFEKALPAYKEKLNTVNLG
ncbi:MAG: DHH family phosphoesterase [Chitinophagales bacterium]